MKRFFDTGRYSLVKDKMLPLIEQVGSIDGKTVLDVGAFDGKNTAYLRSQGATAYALEPIEEARVERDRVIKATLQKLPEEYFGKFDAVFVSLFSVSEDREGFFKKLNQACSPDGVVVIGTENEDFVTGRFGIKTLASYAHSLFSSVKVSFTDSFLNKFVIVCKVPVPITEERIVVEPHSPRL